MQQWKCSSTRVLVFYSNKVVACFLVSLSFATQRALIQVFVDIDKLEWLCKLKKTGKNRRSSTWIYNVMYRMHFVSFYWLNNPSIINVFTNLTHNEYWCQIQWYHNAWFAFSCHQHITCPRKKSLSRCLFNNFTYFCLFTNVWKRRLFFKSKNVLAYLSQPWIFLRSTISLELD